MTTATPAQSAKLWMIQTAQKPALMSAEENAVDVSRVIIKSKDKKQEKWTHALTNAMKNGPVSVATTTATTATVKQDASMTNAAMINADSITITDATSATNATTPLADSKIHASMSVMKDGATITVCIAKTTHPNVLKNASRDAPTVLLAIPRLMMINKKVNHKKVQTVAHMARLTMESVSS